MSGETRSNLESAYGDEEVPPSSVTTDGAQVSINSDVTDHAPSTPGISLPSLTPVTMGLPVTPPSRVLNMPSIALLDQGYDSDMQMGPFVETGVTDEAFVSMDEDVPEEVAQPLQVPEVVPETGSDPVLTSEMIDKMVVAELKVALDARGMSKIGLKAVLIERLKEAVKNAVPIVQDRPPEVADNSAGKDFDPGAYWKLLEPDGEEVDESIMNVDGVNFRAPTVPEAEHNVEFDRRPKKKSYNITFDRLPFVCSVMLPIKRPNGGLKQKANGEYCYEKQSTTRTVPNLEFLFEKGINFDSHPADWFELFSLEVEQGVLTQRH